MGRRDEQRRLAGGGCRWRTGGWRFAPGEEVGRGLKLRGLQRGTAMDGEEVVKRWKIMIHKMEKKNWGGRAKLKSNNK